MPHIHLSVVSAYFEKCNSPLHSLECKTYTQNIVNNECVCNICIVSNAKWKWVGSEGSWRGGIIHKSAVPPPIRMNSTHYTITVHSTKVANGGGVVELEYYRCGALMWWWLNIRMEAYFYSYWVHAHCSGEILCPYMGHHAAASNQPVNIWFRVGENQHSIVPRKFFTRTQRKKFSLKCNVSHIANHFHVTRLCFSGQ